MLQNVKVSLNRSVTPKRIVVGNQFESGVEQIHFDIPDMEGYKYLVLNKPNKKESYPIPLDEGTFYVDSRVTYYLDGVWIANVVISKSAVTEGKLNPDVVTFISDDIILIVKNNYINNEYLKDLPLPQNLQIVYDKLFDTYTQIKSDYDSGAFDGKDGYSPTLDVTPIDNGNRITITDINGEKEIDVTNGIDGQSAYELAVKNGFEGSEQEWLESLRYDHSEEFTQLAEQVKKDAQSSAENAANAETAMNQANQTAQDNIETIQQASEQAQEDITNAKTTSINAVVQAQQTAEQSIATKHSEAVQAVEQAQSTAETAINAKQTESVNAVATSKEEATKAIETGKTEAVTAIETAKDEAIEEIENTGVPLEDIEKLAIKETATGNPTIISDSADWRLQKFNIYGQSSQDGTPTPESPIEIISKEVSEIKVTNGADLSQTITLAEPITLRGLPVTLVDGNIVINGEQYISDCIKEKDGIIGVERNLNELLVSSLGSAYLDQGAHTNGQNYLLCDVGNTYSLAIPLSNRYRGTQFTMNDKCVYIPSAITIIITDSRFTNKETAISIITEEQTKVIYVMNEPTFEPLPEEIQAQYKALKSYYPNTVIQTGCWNEVEYVADTQKWIEKKLTGVTELALGGK